jgi:transcription termination/antitermination protein NusG
MLNDAILEDNFTLRWYAAYTRSNHEKSSAQQMAKRSIEHLVPTYESVRTWRDRRKRLDLPLFPGYVFVRVALENRLSVLNVPGVVRLVGFANRPVALADAEIEKLRTVVKHGLHAEPHAYLTIGRRVRITRGALQGMEGLLIRKKGRVRLLLSVDLIRQSAMIEVDSSDVEPVSVSTSSAISRVA